MAIKSPQAFAACGVLLIVAVAANALDFTQRKAGAQGGIHKAQAEMAALCKDLREPEKTMMGCNNIQAQD